MKTRLLFAAVLALLIASCGGGDGGNTANGTTPATPVAARPAPAGQNWVDTVVATPEWGYRMGNPDAPIKVIEYGSRACPFCAAFAAEGMEPLRQKYISTGKVSFEFRDYPIHGALDVAPILLGHCVDASVFFPLMEQMMANQPTLLAKEQEVGQRIQATQGASPAQIATMFAEGLGYLDFVKQRGVPEAKARACLNDPAGLDALTKSTEKANNDFRVSSTPTLILNGTSMPLSNTEATWPQLERALKAAGA